MLVIAVYAGPFRIRKQKRRIVKTQEPKIPDF